MTEQLPLRRLDDWWRRNFRDARNIRIQARIGDRYWPIVELGDVVGQTCKLLLAKSEMTPFNGSCRNRWIKSWAAPLVAACLVAPVFDPLRFRELANEQRRLRLFVDTNALAGGIVPWLLSALGRTHADIITSAIVDRELAAWPDRESNFWQPKSIDAWKLRTHYRLARQVIETPQSEMLVDRLSPEQSALILAKVRDEDPNEKKSPDADVLLVELARRLVRDQPRGARVIFLTGDRTAARTAVSALGHENVLYVAADDSRALQAIQSNKTCVRGNWSPDGGPLGTYHLPPVQDMLGVLLAASDGLEISDGSATFCMKGITAVPRGVPSDWIDPWVKVSSPQAERVALLIASSESEHATVATEVLPPQAEAGGSLIASSEGENATIATEDRHDRGRWLLPPQQSRPSLGGAKSWRLDPSIFFTALTRILARRDASLEDLGTAQSGQETLRALDLLEIPTRVDEFEEAWKRSDHDWFHTEFLRLSAYEDAIREVQSRKNGEKLSQRQKANLKMARSLGQVARTQPRNGTLVIGDRPLTTGVLTASLRRWLGSPGASRTTQELAFLALTELQITPFRFQLAMERLWQSNPRLEFEAGVGGTSEKHLPELIILMNTKHVDFKSVDPGTLTFGYSSPVRFVKWRAQ